MDGRFAPSPSDSLQVPDAGAELELRAKRLDGDCGAAVWGAGVAGALREGGCTQAVRGVYAGKDHALTVAVFFARSALPFMAALAPFGLEKPSVVLTVAIR